MEPSFPCDAIPGEARLARLAGLYPQKKEGLWMQRLKVLGGRLSAEQWAALAELARRHTPGVPLHLTTRQDVEFHGLTVEAVGPLHRDLAAVGLTGLGAGGDTLRNITVCASTGLLPGRPELEGTAWAIRQTLEDLEGIYSLPRKLKISLSCGEGCGQPWINDLGLVARRRGEQWGFRVIAGGSLGPRPATGVVVSDWLAADDVVPLAVGAVRVFAAEGDRANRGKARLRHVRERVGDLAFVGMLAAALGKAKAERAWRRVTLAPAPDRWLQQAVLTFLHGSVTPEAAEAIGRLASRPEAAVRITNHHRVAVFGQKGTDAGVLVAGEPALAEAAKAQAAIVACPGSRWCSRALVDTQAMATAIRRELAGAIPPGATVCISGCPNGCAQNAVADVGLSGRVVTAADGTKVDAFDISLGGGMGRTPALGTPAASKVPAGEVPAELAKLLHW